MRVLYSLLLRYYRAFVKRTVGSVFFKKRLPVIYQTDFIECGLACLVMIFRFHGISVRLNDLRQRYAVNLSGMSVRALLAIANDFGIQIQVLRVDLKHLDTIQLPAILHWNFDHYVVFKKVTKKYFIVHDPSRGRVKLSRAQFSQQFTGIVLEFTVNKHSKLNHVPNLNIFSNSLMTLFQPVWSNPTLCLKMLSITAIYQLFLMATPWVLQLGLNALQMKSHDQDLFYIAGGYLILQLVIHVSKWLKMLCQLKLEFILNQHLGSQLMRKLFELPLVFYEQRQLSNILYRFHCLDQIRQLFSNGLIDIFWSTLLFICTAIYLYYLSCKLAIITTLFALLHLSIRYYLAKSQRIKVSDWVQAKNREQSTLLETIRAMLPIKVFIKKPYYFQKWLNHYTYFLKSSYQVAHSKAMIEQIKSILSVIELTCIIVSIAYLHAANTVIMLGTLYAYFYCRQLFIDNLSAFADRWHDISMLPVYLDRLSDILQPAQSLATIPPPILMSTCNVIKAVDLGFRHSAFEPWLFQALNFTITKGETVVFVGPSGSGKSTLIKVLLGLLSAEEGQVQMSGVVDEKGLTRAPRVAAVMQNDVLLTGTIAENICFFSAEPDSQKIRHCAKLASIWDEVLHWPLQLGTMVGEMGASLSGGQRQRILLARALYSDPEILFLDEATSHLDELTERTINVNLKSLGITCVLVAHRTNTIAMADRVIELPLIRSSAVAA